MLIETMFMVNTGPYAVTFFLKLVKQALLMGTVSSIMFKLGVYLCKHSLIELNEQNQKKEIINL